jgi:hypothetical protein
MKFKNYCKQNGLFTKDASIATHLFMDGGMLSVDTQKLPEFLNTYVNCLVNGEVITLVEKLGKNCTMRFFMDIDKTDEIDDIITAGTKVIGMFPSVYQCTQRKGYHLIFNKEVTNKDAIEFGTKIKDELKTSRKNVVDLSVYNTGLRMIGSHKYCNVKHEYEHRSYMPMNDTSPITLDILKPSIVRIRPVIPNKEKNNSGPNERSHSTLNKYFKKLNNAFDNINVRNIQKLDNNTYCVSVESKFCININKEHTKNHVYFVIHKGQMYQKCHSNNMKTAGRLYNYCHCFKSMPVKLSQTDYNNIISI